MLKKHNRFTISFSIEHVSLKEKKIWFKMEVCIKKIKVDFNGNLKRITVIKIVC